jgi:hypothetical protein
VDGAPDAQALCLHAEAADDGGGAPRRREALGRDATLRLAFHIDSHNIPRARVVNADQTSALLVPSSQHGRALAATGETNAQVLGTGDKRNATGIVGFNALVQAIGAQIICKGGGKEDKDVTNSRAVPPPNVVRFFKQHGGDIVNTPKGWSNLRLMKRWATEVLEPYYRSVGGGPAAVDGGGDGDGCGCGGTCVLILDVWHVHISNAFRAWMRDEYPWIKMLYVPANCTSVLQPCDMGAMKPFKAALQEALCQDLVAVLDKAAAAAQRDGGDADAAHDAAGKAFLRIGSLRARVPGYVVGALKAAEQLGFDPSDPDAGNAIKRTCYKTWGMGWQSANFRREARAHVARLFRTAEQQDEHDGEEDLPQPPDEGE